MYVLGSRQKEMYRSCFSHIVPDLVDGIVRQSYLSDVFSFGQLIGRVAHLRTRKGLQQLAPSVHSIHAVTDYSWITLLVHLNLCFSGLYH